MLVPPMPIPSTHQPQGKSGVHQTRSQGPHLAPSSWGVLVVCGVLPWLFSGWYGPAVGVGLLGVWFGLVRPSWRGLAPFYLTALLLVNLVLRVCLVVWG